MAAPRLLGLLLCSSSTAAALRAHSAAGRPCVRPTTSRVQLFFGEKSAEPPPPPQAPQSTPSTQVFRRDLYAYGALLSLGSVPAFDWAVLGGSDAANTARLLYFTTLAIGTVYLGVQRQDLGEASPISSQSAALAPVFASVTLGGLYFLIKYTGLNPGMLYQFFACLFALLATSDLLQPLFGLAVAGALLVPADDEFDEEREAAIMNCGALPAFALALALVACYLQGPVSTGGTLSLPVFATLNNYLGWAISMASLGVLALESYIAGAALLVGLVLYDAFFVFKSDAMLTVATQIEAPAKFLFAAVRDAGDTRYPFSVLGLGDVVVPGAFVSLLREVDRDGVQGEPPQTSRSTVLRDSSWDANSYFYTGLAAYAVGLLATFVANYVTKAGQPALVYIVPSLLIASSVTALTRGEFQLLLQYRSSRAAAATEARRAWEEARAAEKEAAAK